MQIDMVLVVLDGVEFHQEVMRAGLIIQLSHMETGHLRHMETMQMEIMIGKELQCGKKDGLIS